MSDFAYRKIWQRIKKTAEPKLKLLDFDMADISGTDGMGPTLDKLDSLFTKFDKAEQKTKEKMRADVKKEMTKYDNIFQKYLKSMDKAIAEQKKNGPASRKGLIKVLDDMKTDMAFDLNKEILEDAKRLANQAGFH